MDWSSKSNSMNKSDFWIFSSSKFQILQLWQDISSTPRHAKSSIYNHTRGPWLHYWNQIQAKVQWYFDILCNALHPWPSQHLFFPAKVMHGRLMSVAPWTFQNGPLPPLLSCLLTCRSSTSHFSTRSIFFIRDTLKWPICLSLKFYLMFSQNFMYGPELGKDHLFGIEINYWDQDQRSRSRLRSRSFEKIVILILLP